MAADGSIIIEAEIDDKKAQQELSRLNRKIETLNEQIYVKQQQKMPLVEQAQRLGAELDAAKAKLDNMENSGRFFTSAHVDEQRTIVSNLQKEWDGVVVQIERMDRGIQETTTRLNLAKERAGEVYQSMARTGPAAEAMARAVDRAQKSTQRFSMRLREVLRSALIFTIISQGAAALREWLGKVIKPNDETVRAIGRLKGALLTLAQPLIEVIIPAFTAFVNVLTRIVSAVASLVAALFGMTADQAADAAENLYNEANAVEGVGDAAKEAGKSLASFDEINKLSGGGAASGGTGAGASEGIKPVFDDFSTAEYKRKIDELTAYVSGALLALGALLAFSGVNIPLGLALMAAGAVGLVSVVSENWGSLDGPLLNAITRVLVILGDSALVIGAILAFSGVNIPLGIGLMVAGALALGTVVAINWDSMPTEMQKVITGMLELLSVSLLVIGALLAFSGANIPLGIGMMIAGASAMAAAVSLNWGSATISVKQVITEIMSLLGVSLLALGAVLTFSGAKLPLGIGMMLAGAVSLATAAAINWDIIQTALQGPIGAVTAIVSGALLVLGVILLFTGAGIPLGLGLIATGAAGLVVAIVPNWNFILDAISGAWSNFTSWWDAGPSKFFTLDYWLGLGQDMLDGLFNGLSSIGQKITEWGGNFIDGVKDFFGIHSPSTEFEDLGGYMMSGLENGVNDNSTMVVSAFSIMFNAVLALCTNNTELMKASLVAFLLYMTGEFAPAWNKTWTDCYNKASQNIQGVIAEINALNAKLASIERNITITITTVYKTVGKSSSGSSSSSRSGRASARSVSLPMQNIPALARGAVIPPNREFLAVLGDQKSGTNVEAPLDTIVQAVMMALARSGMNADGQLIENVINLDGEVIYRNQKKVARRHGMSLTNR